MNQFEPMVVALLLLLGATVAAVAATAGEVYTWTDEDGVVHFTDREPVDRKAELRYLPDDPPPSTTHSNAYPEDGSPAAGQRHEGTQREAHESPAWQEQTEQRCRAWQSEIDRLGPGQRVLYRNDKGELEHMEDGARTELVAALEDLITQNCD